jgi:hypothetical protein
VDKNQNIDVDYNYPFPFVINEITYSIMKKCFSNDNWNFKEINNSKENDLVVQINGGRFKQYKKLFVGISKDSSHNAQTLILNKKIPIQNVQSVFKSKLFTFVFKVYGGESGQSSTGILKKLPYLPLDKLYTDNTIYKEFGLTSEETDYIENYVI